MTDFLRKYAAALSLATFAVAAVTGIFMFYGVHNRQLGELHEWFGIGFVVAALLHLLRNAKAFVAMLGQTRSLVIVGLLGGGGLLLTGMALYGPASGGHGGPSRAQAMVVAQLADAPIAQSAPAFGLSPETALARLRQGGVAVRDSGQTLSDVARTADRPAPQLFLLMLGRAADGAGRHAPGRNGPRGGRAP